MAYEAELDFYTQLAKLQAARDAAFKTKAKDPAKWQKAKSEYRQFATAIKVLAGRTTEGSAVLNVVPETAMVKVTAKNTGG